MTIRFSGRFAPGVLRQHAYAGSGIRFARLLHAAAHKPLEVFLSSHRLTSSTLGRGRESPSNSQRSNAKDLVDANPRVCPPLPLTGPGWGWVAEVRRGLPPPERCKNPVKHARL